ncbi:GNAT family N-acetyltransferase [Streptomyces zagrosensis]|uniref:GNAT superfamily N-acetyltransferase n=1 Tax=Streptomyces zagrosensis TaxID=1042984 RepID=A0A7W9Q9G9_9ACTN|nr:GNAT family N-acetyltransferase [Streptomyces zagrosensis]MBB5936085.1 GNAT superfamily N-acetyltransferase [Streptomyces zagrosensis]
MTDLVIRQLSESDAHLFHTLPDPELVGHAAFERRYATVAVGGEYRPEWTWVALREDTVVARAAWWAGPSDDKPIALDWFDFTDRDAAVELLRTAPFRSDYVLLLPPNWQQDPALREAAQARAEAARAAGMDQLVDRYRYTWTPDCGVPAQPGRLTFRPEPDDAEILSVLRRIQHGTLDAHARRTIGTAGHDAAAQEEMDFFRWCPSPREWWRTAWTREGELVGLHIPARNQTSPVIGSIGVVPEHRGHGYAYDLLADCTRLLAAEGVTQIIAETDHENRPMAMNFTKAGYPVTQERSYFEWPRTAE